MNYISRSNSFCLFYIFYSSLKDSPGAKNYNLYKYQSSTTTKKTNSDFLNFILNKYEL